MRKMFMLLLTVIILAGCSRQVSLKPSVIGGKKYDSARDLVITKDGYAMAGMTQSLGLGEVDAYLIITDKKGKLKSQNTYGGKGDDRALALAAADDAGFVIAGYTTSYGAGNNDVYIVKTGENGKYISAKVFGGKGFEEARGIVNDGTGGYIAAGHSNSFGKGDYDAYIIRLDAAGDCVWAKTFGGEGNERIHSVIPAGGGRFMAVGSSNTNSGKLPDAYTLLFDINGNKIKENFYGDEYADSAASAAAVKDGNFVIAGEKGTKDSVLDIVIYKISPEGTVLWEKTFGDIRSEYPSRIIQTSDGGFAVAAVTESQGRGLTDILIMKIDSHGNMLWQKLFGGREDEYAGGLAEDSDGGLAFAGWTKSFGNGDYDIYMFKLDRDGSLEK